MILFWVSILATAVVLYTVVHHTASGREQAFPFSRFLQEVERGNVKEVTIAESDVKGKLANNESFKTVMPMKYPELINMLRDKQVVITGEKPTQNPWLAAMVSWAPFLFLRILVFQDTRSPASSMNWALVFQHGRKASVLVLAGTAATTAHVASAGEAISIIAEI